ncbi:envelope stress response membrane protein PspB [Beggiatoa leptomitoformis]|uniref:Envelope stress response membrane protein PspB n=1 Tax=Beggiatoa leptomitoformis TaxID=288004 RepID=A0A2N9YDC1_9GAMM|nr:envelope stress response membrane protein PspB [Beggiatoa leptomitoformis]ALG69106.1 envelope stress response membrane protein PspB [Beggiatoa leptomitoformis]AUI68480.1 envelope stress response membrane protein PspB [Beggiatoa leptomitoformis]
MKELIDLLSVVLVFVVPLWLILHYRWKNKSKGGLSPEDKQQVMQLYKKAKGLEERINVLESILDDQIPDWRKQK